MKIIGLLIPLAALVLSACGQHKPEGRAATVPVNRFQTDSLPQPYATPVVQNYSKVVGWKPGEAPVAPAGFVVSLFASGLENPRWIYAAPNGDIFVAESNTILHGVKKFGAAVSRKIKTQHLGESANRILLFRDRDGNGSYPEVDTFAENLNQNFGMLILGDHFYVANTDGVYIYPYKNGDRHIEGTGRKILSLPAGGYNNHWTRNLLTNYEGTKIYVTVGSGSNNAEHGIAHEYRRANILEINPDGTGEKIFAYGMRNPVGLSVNPVTKQLWTVVNERDNLGDELVPDYATSVTPGGFYGWPYSYFGKNPDPRMKDDPHPELIAKAIVPDISLGAHTASLGLAFYTGTSFPPRYRNGLFIGQHGSWNRTQLAGYRVAFVPFENGKPAGKPEDFLTGFIINASKSEVHGRPVGVAVLKDGSLLVADDAGNCIWRVQAK